MVEHITQQIAKVEVLYFSKQIYWGPFLLVTLQNPILISPLGCFPNTCPCSPRAVIFPYICNSFITLHRNYLLNRLSPLLEYEFCEARIPVLLSLNLQNSMHPFFNKYVLNVYSPRCVLGTRWLAKKRDLLGAPGCGLYAEEPQASSLLWESLPSPLSLFFLSL